MQIEWVTTIRKYFDDLENGDLEVRNFCSGFEVWWNQRPPANSDIRSDEFEALEAVFSVVVMYSDNAAELEHYPMYKSESDVRAVVASAQKVLRNR